MNLGTVPEWYMEEVWARDDLNEWWTTVHYDPEGHILTNIRCGDMFTLGKHNQFGLVTRRTLNVGVDIEAYYSYEISGDIGGNWFHPKLDWFTPGHPRFIPNTTQLMEIATVIRDDWFGIMCGKLMTHYNRNPFQRTDRLRYTKLGI